MPGSQFTSSAKIGRMSYLLTFYNRSFNLLIEKHDLRRALHVSSVSKRLGSMSPVLAKHSPNFVCHLIDFAPLTNLNSAIAVQNTLRFINAGLNHVEETDQRAKDENTTFHLREMKTRRVRGEKNGDGKT